MVSFIQFYKSYLTNFFVDGDYRNNLTSEAQMCASLNSPPPNSPNSLLSGTTIEDFSSKVVWLEAPTKMLLSLMEELAPRVGKSLQLKNKNKMWKLISEKLTAEGYPFSPSQVQTKFRTLERQYKKIKLHNTKTGRDRQNCSFER